MRTETNMEVENVLTKDAIPTLNLPVTVPEESYNEDDGAEIIMYNKLLEENEKLEALVKTQKEIVWKLKISKARRKKKLEEMKKTVSRDFIPIIKQKQLLSKVYTDNQIKIIFGKRKAHWTDDELTVAYTVRHLSSKKFYDYLTQTLKFPLPGTSSIRRWCCSKSKKIKTTKQKK